jgi:hypothetical protein
VLVLRLVHAITKPLATVTRTLLAYSAPPLCDLAAILERPAFRPGVRCPAPLELISEGWAFESLPRQPAYGTVLEATCLDTLGICRARGPLGSLGLAA